ncbi:MAG: RES domain-containing protein, partial [Sphingobacteriales bacterium]
LMNDEEIQPIIKGGVFDPGWVLGLQDLPDMDTLLQNLNDLLSTDKSKMSADEIKQLFFRKIVLFPNSADKIPAATFNIQKFARVRRNVGAHEDINTMAPFTYPPKCTTNGRANIIGQSVFYCSNTLAASLFECRPAVGEIVYFSDWSACCTDDVNIRFLLSDNISVKNPLYPLALRRLAEIKAMAEAWGMEKAPKLELITRFLGNAFISEEHPYPLSSWIANDILFGKQAVDVLYYPSVMTEQVSCNLAMTPTFVDRFLRPNRVFKMEIIEKTSRSIRPQVLAVGTMAGNKVIWDNIRDEDMAFFH